MSRAAIMSSERKAYDRAQEQHNPYIWVLNIIVQRTPPTRLSRTSSNNVNSLATLAATFPQSIPPGIVAADQPETLAEFQLFPKLPCDIRVMIWELALPEGRTISVTGIRRFIQEIRCKAESFLGV
ncbi:hypothetical protein ACEPPN_010678 [Leptodophora sp. 'Broadleaf-Isolate-01']